MTEAEILEFAKADDIDFTDVDNSTSEKSNFYVMGKNFISLALYLKKLKAYVTYVKGLIDIDNLIQTVLEKYQTAKNIIVIDISLQVGESSFQTVNSVNYAVKRLDSYIVEISNLSNTEWIVDNLMVQVKNSDGVIVTPVVITAQNKITIHFIDGLTSTYKIFFM